MPRKPAAFIAKQFESATDNSTHQTCHARRLFITGDLISPRSSGCGVSLHRELTAKMLPDQAEAGIVSLGPVWNDVCN